ncbi:MAG: multidrug efflux RND transporter permease subunit [Methylobacillus sp.]|jgi:multidrug efflux pump|nr:multidrug efflux RND transporter permease subunit [Methylobacillus sp.]
MNISALFIHRPVATTLLTLGILLSGMLAFDLLPVAPLPQVDYPTISVSASLPGASPDTMAATVATPLERSLGAIAGVTEITSSSSLGSTRITLQFDLSRDIDGAARDVQAALNAARSLLPTGMTGNPTYRKVNPADAPIMILSLTSPTYSRAQMYDAASTILAQKISQIDGIGQVTVGGASLPAVRVELDPRALNAMGLGPEDVRSAIAATNVNRPKGNLEQGDRYWQILANDQARTAADYIPAIVSWRNGAPVRIGDVARVEDSMQDVRNMGLVNGETAVMLILYRQPGANIIETVDRVTEMIPALHASIPGAMNLATVMDRSPTIRASLLEVERTLILSVILVVFVVVIFLRSGRVALIPAVVVPVSLIGTFSFMYLAGFSLNTLSLMALTIATGFVVDDAVVVVENVSRHIENGVKPMAAALQGAREVGFTIISMSLSLIAVFIPILLMGGIVGRLFREFALTLSVSILISLVLSLSVTPMMCARLLREKGEEKPGLLFRASERVFDWVLAGYRNTLGWALDHGKLMLLLLAVTIGLNVLLYSVVPKTLFPQQDIGRLMGRIQADQSISFQAMQEKLRNFVAILQTDTAVENVAAFASGAQGMVFVSLKPLAERKVTTDAVINRLGIKLNKEPGAKLYLQGQQDIRVGGRSSNAQYQYTLQGDDINELRVWGPRVRLALSKLPELTDVNTDEQDKGMQTTLMIDRDAAARLGVSVRAIDSTLNNLFGQSIASTIYNPLNQYYVVMEAAPEYLQSPEILKDVYVTATNADGSKTPVPLSAMAHYEPTFTPLSVNHQGQFAATTISFNLPEGVSLSQATEAIDAAMLKLGVPTSIHGGFQGTAKMFQASLDSQPWLILAALITVYLVLGILYESLVHPLTILSTLPSAGVGAILALLVFKTDFSIIALIGVILLIGIVKKNAIMMIDFAIDAEREENLTPREAIHRACLLRFRPIMMTTMAALFGAIPLALGTGDGAEFRQPLGIAIVGGLILSQLLTLYTTPVIYLSLDKLRLRYADRRARRNIPPDLTSTGAVT